MLFLYWQHLIICEICYMCPLTNCHIWLIFATPLMGDEPPPLECQPICVLTHTWRILGLPSGPHQYLCVVCLKTFRIGLSNFAYLFHIIHNISNTCQSVWLTFPSHSRLPHFQGNISKPKTSQQPKVCLEKRTNIFF